MKSHQQLATGVAAVLMTGILLALPTHHRAAAQIVASHSAQVSHPSRVSAELPQEQVRDLSYN